MKRRRALLAQNPWKEGEREHLIQEELRKRGLYDV